MKTERRSPARGLGVFLSPVWSFVRTHHRPYHRPYHSSYHCLLLTLQTTHNGSLHSLHWLAVARQWLTFSVLLHFTPKHPSVIAIVKFDIYWVWGGRSESRQELEVDNLCQTGGDWDWRQLAQWWEKSSHSRMSCATPQSSPCISQAGPGDVNMKIWASRAEMFVFSSPHHTARTAEKKKHARDIKTWIWMGKLYFCQYCPTNLIPKVNQDNLDNLAVSPGVHVCRYHLKLKWFFLIFWFMNFDLSRERERQDKSRNLPPSLPPSLPPILTII